MKTKLILLLYLSLLCVGLNAQQQYIHILDEGTTKWSVFNECVDRSSWSDEYITYGQSTINEVLYINVYGFSNRYEFHLIPLDEDNIAWKNYIYDPECEYNSSFVIYLRENENASKLYRYNGETDELIFDLNLNVGDEFLIKELSRFPLVVDSVYIENGLKHIRFDYPIYAHGNNCGERGCKFTFIEGIGSNMGLFPNNGCPPLLNCFQSQSLFYKNEQLLLPCGYYDLYSAIESPNMDDDFWIQRTKQSIEIRFSKSEPIKLVLYDILGNPLYQKTSYFEGNTIISTASFPQGIYLLKIDFINRNKSSIRKIIL